jgi:hypothetical protein
MSNLAIKQDIKSTNLELVVDNTQQQILIEGQKYNKLVFYLGLTLILIQILDGIMTSVGIATYGIKAEGNPLLYMLMQQYDYMLVLFFTKSIAILIILGICHSAKFINWIHYAMFTVIGIYLSAAIIPWAWILLSA